MGLQSCALCGRDNYTTLLTLKPRNGTIRSKSGKVSILKCNNCGLVRLDPFSSTGLIDLCYSREYYGTMGRWTDNFYRLQIAREFLLSVGSTGKVLEVGSGDGSFLDIMKKHGWEVSGVDVSTSAVELAREKVGHDSIFYGSLRDAGFQSSSHDAICFRHVVEHLDKPLEDLNEARRVLRDTGFLCIVVPNIESLGFAIFGKNWFHLDIPRHSYFYSPRTLNALAKKAGFRKVKHSASFEDPLDSLRSLCGFLRIDSNFPRSFLPFIVVAALATSPLSFLLSKLNHGTSIQCYFKKASTKQVNTKKRSLN